MYRFSQQCHPHINSESDPSSHGSTVPNGIAISSDDAVSDDDVSEFEYVDTDNYSTAGIRNFQYLANEASADDAIMMHDENKRGVLRDDISTGKNQSEIDRHDEETVPVSAAKDRTAGGLLLPRHLSSSDKMTRPEKARDSPRTCTERTERSEHPKRNIATGSKKRKLENEKDVQQLRGASCGGVSGDESNFDGGVKDIDSGEDDLGSNHEEEEETARSNVKNDVINPNHVDKDGDTPKTSTRKQKISFNDRFKHLLAFKTKYRHCNVPRSHNGEYASLGEWCSHVRHSYKKIQNNQIPKHKLSNENIQRLTDAGFKWSLPNRSRTFDDRFGQLLEYKLKHGHCNVPHRSKNGEYGSLGNWCSRVRHSYKKIQNNQQPSYKLSNENIESLTDAGFKWSLRNRSTSFDDRFGQLLEYKLKHGHCNVPQQRSKNGQHDPLGGWCSQVRQSYKKIQNNQTPNNKLSKENIKSLTDAGFKWRLQSRSTFDDRFGQLLKYKVDHGNCNVPKQSKNGEYGSLGEWCSQVRQSRKKIQKNQTPSYKLSNENIKCLTDAGFQWNSRY
jgi:hypothetical protein